jgi:hypothetical protein
MGTHTVTLSKLSTWVSRMQEAKREADRERENIKRLTLGWADYCRIHSISRPTLNKRRELGLISFVMLGSEYRYLRTVDNGGCYE